MRAPGERRGGGRSCSICRLISQGLPSSRPRGGALGGSGRKRQRVNIDRRRGIRVRVRVSEIRVRFLWHLLHCLVRPLSPSPLPSPLSPPPLPLFLTPALLCPRTSFLYFLSLLTLLYCEWWFIICTLHHTFALLCFALVGWVGFVCVCACISSRHGAQALSGN